MIQDRTRKVAKTWRCWLDMLSIWLGLRHDDLATVVSGANSTSSLSQWYSSEQTLISKKCVVV